MAERPLALLAFFSAGMGGMGADPCPVMPLCLIWQDLQGQRLQRGLRAGRLLTACAGRQATLTFLTWRNRRAS